MPMRIRSKRSPSERSFQLDANSVPVSAGATSTPVRSGPWQLAQDRASCHGPDLTGVDVAPALTGTEFASNWNDLSLGDLFERIRIGMPADKPGSLSRQDD